MPATTSTPKSKRDELIDVAAKLFVVCAVCAVARVARDDLSWSGMATAAALAAAAYALRGETLGDNEHPDTF